MTGKNCRTLSLAAHFPPAILPKERPCKANAEGADIMINIKWKALKYATVLVLAFAFQNSVRAQDSAPAASGNMTGAAAEPQAATGNVPRLVKFSGVATDPDGKPATGTVSLTFTLYKTQEEGAALWTETQSTQLDSQGHYTVLLG